jgi:hypothetical protein
MAVRLAVAFLHTGQYSKRMDVIIKFSQSAFKHGVSEADIRWAVDTAKYDGFLDDEDAENKHLLIGFDRNANPIEIFYNILDRDTGRVFHAMKCRNTFKHLLEKK